MLNDITPLEEAVLNAQDFSAGMALSGMIQTLIDRSDELEKTVKDRSLDREKRTAALQERRNINLQLNIVASANAVAGIGAQMYTYRATIRMAGCHDLTVEVRAVDQIQAKSLIRSMYSGATIIGDHVYRVQSVVLVGIIEM